MNGIMAPPGAFGVGISRRPDAVLDPQTGARRLSRSGYPVDGLTSHIIVWFYWSAEVVGWPL